MKPRFEQVVYPEQTCLAVRHYQARQFRFQWHHHPEAELTWVDHSRGRRYVGDHVDSYVTEDLVLLGPDLSHTWFGSPSGRSRAEATVLQFLPERLLGKDVPGELHGLSGLMSRAATGLQFGPAVRARVQDARQVMVNESGAARWIAVLEILQVLAEAEAEALASPGFAEQHRGHDPRMEKVMAHLNAHFTETLSLGDLAGVASMSRSAFSRFFHRKAGRRFVDYLGEVRLSHACTLLRDTDHSVTEICYASGFGNLSNFNRRFRASRGKTPRSYRKQWREEREP